MSGGEPLLTFDLVEYITKKVKKELPKDKYRVVLSTNGTLINDKIAKFIVKENILPIVSLDGTIKNNYQRVYRNGLQSYDDALAGIKKLKEHGCKTLLFR